MSSRILPKSRPALILAGLLLAIPSGAQGATPASGGAATENIILSVRLGGTEISVASDVAESDLGSASRAHASFVAGATTDSRIGVAEKTATSDAEAGSDTAEVGDLSLDDVLSLTLASAAVDVDVTAGAVSSSAVAALANVDVLGGTFSFDGLTSSSATAVDAQAATALRAVTLDGVSLMRIGPLLEQLGIDPLSLACGAIEDAGASLNVETSQACEELDAAETAIGDAGDELATAAAFLGGVTDGFVESEVEADRAAAAALSCDTLDLVCIAAALSQLTSFATEYGIPLSDPTSLPATRDEVIAGLDEILVAFADSTVVNEALTDIAAGTCDAAGDAITAALDDLSSADPAGLSAVLPPIRDAIDTACAALREILNDLLGTSLLSFDGVEISMSADARENDPGSAVQASIGSVRVGLNEGAEVGLEDAEEMSEALGAQIEQFFAALGFGFTAPSLDFLVVESASGQDGDDWFSEASLTTVRISLPAGSLEIPDEPPLGVLDDGAGGFGAAHVGVLGVPVGAMLAAVVPSPDIVVEGAVFSVGSTFTPASADDGDDDDGDDVDDDDDDDSGGNGGTTGGGDPRDRPLARTGQDLPRAIALALILSVAGAHIRRLGRLSPDR